MNTLSWLFLLALVAVLDAARFKCDYTYYKDARGYLKFQEMPLTFNDAKKECALEGGILASPINDVIKAGMISIMKTSNVNCAAFTGFSAKSNRRAIFASVEGIRLSEIPHTWAPNEPDNYKDKESCIAMLPDGTIADVKCDEPFPHFCFLNEVRAKKLNACGPKNNNYTLDSSTGSCYKFHRTKLDYDAATKVCEGEGGYLLIINGDNEAQAVKNLFSKIPISEVGEHALSGFRLNNDTREWMTLQGETIEEAGYAKWAPGEPNNNFGSTNEFCGAVKRSLSTLMLNDIVCNFKYTFICEKDPEIFMCK